MNSLTKESLCIIRRNCIKTVDFHQEKRSYGGFCIENVQRDVIQHKLALLHQILERKIDFDKLTFRHENRSFGEFCFDIIENEFSS